MSDVVKRLSSRKFLLAVSALTGFLATRQYDQAVLVVLGYLGVEGGVDAVNARKAA